MASGNESPVSCRRALEIDLAGFLAEPRAPDYADFREHYPRCPACAAELRVWTELQRELEAAHPTPERLAAYAREAASFDAAERRSLTAHLERCAPCRDELAGLERFAPESLRAAVAAGGPAPRPGREPLLARLRGWLWHPAFAYGVASLLLVSFVWLWRMETQPATGPVVASVDRPVTEPSALRKQQARADAERDEAEVPVAPEAEERFAAEAGRRPAAPSPAPALDALDAALKEVARPVEESMPGPGRRRALEEKAAAAGAAGLAQAEAATPSRQPTARFELRREGELRVSAQAASAGLRLGVPLPPDLPAPGSAEIRLRDLSGRRELRERRGWETRPPTLVLAVPPGWLAPGMYDVELVPGEGAPQTFRLRVLGP